MPPDPPNLNPSQTVERIREILVGRQLDRLQERIERLEQRTPEASSSDIGEQRMLAAEAQLEALRDQLRRDGPARPAAVDLATMAELREETRRLSAQIQTIVAERMGVAATGDGVARLESRVGTWLGEWQRAVHQQSVAREEALTARLREETATLWEGTEAQITRVESRCAERDAVEERFRGIARAARALAESAWPGIQQPEGKS